MTHPELHKSLSIQMPLFQNAPPPITLTSKLQIMLMADLHEVYWLFKNN